MISEMEIGRWHKITKNNPLPLLTSEFLVRNDNQGGIYRLIRWNHIHKYFQYKGNFMSKGNVGTHYFIIPEQ